MSLAVYPTYCIALFTRHTDPDLIRNPDWSHVNSRYSDLNPDSNPHIMDDPD